MEQQIALRFGTLESYLKGQASIPTMELPQLEKIGGKAVVFTCYNDHTDRVIPGLTGVLVPCTNSHQLAIKGNQKKLGSTLVEEIMMCLNKPNQEWNGQMKRNFESAFWDPSAHDFRLDNLSAWT